MERALNRIKELIALKAKHRKGFDLSQVQPPFILKQAAEELQELMDAPNDADELADLLGVLLHYIVKQGWTLEMMEDRMLSKFEKRFIVGGQSCQD